MLSLRYELCDVFTDRALEGNALAVFTDAGDLDAATMQKVARELNLSESAFVLPPSTAAADAHIRIFTPTMELPFAGHPTLGTAFVLAATLPQPVIRLETARGIVPVRMSRIDGRAAFGWMSQPLPRVTPYEAVDEALAALDLAAGSTPIELYDNGPRYVFIEAASASAVARLSPDLGRLARLGTTVFSVFAGEGLRWKCRVFGPGEGIPEDPATGAAAGPLALHLARHGHIAFGDEIVIAQGAEIGRPSTLHARVLGSARQVEAVEVGGSAVVVGSGELRLPRLRPARG